MRVVLPTSPPSPPPGPLARAWARLVAVQATDPETARTGRQLVMLMVVALGIVVALAAVFARFPALGYADPTVTWVALAFPLAFLPLSLTCVALAKRGRVRLATQLYVWSNLVGISVAALLFEGIHSPAWQLYVWTVTIAGILLSPGYALGLTALVTTYFFALLALGEAGLYAPRFHFPPDGLAYIETWLRLIIFVSTVGLLTYLNQRTLRQARLDLLRENAERLRAEEDAARARRLEALGRLAGGVAHDFNNVVAVIKSASEPSLPSTPPRGTSPRSAPRVPARRGS